MIHEYQFSIDSIDAANKATHTTYAEDSICNGLAKGRRMLDKLFKDGALTAELWLMGDPADGRRSFSARCDASDFVHVDDGKQWQTRSWRLLRCRPFLERLRSGRQPPR